MIYNYSYVPMKRGPEVMPANEIDETKLETALRFFSDEEVLAQVEAADVSDEDKALGKKRCLTRVF